MNLALVHKKVQDFISANYKGDIPNLILKGSPFEEVTVQELAVQLYGKRIAKKKLPEWFVRNDILYPPKINMEQCSSETTAAYKASLIDGKSILDLTGGFGVDSYFFSKSFSEVVHTELDPDLSRIVGHNFKTLRAQNITAVAGDGLEYLRDPNHFFDWIFLDPARRNPAGGKVITLAECTPNILDHLDLLWSRTSGILIKTSPLLDLSAGIKELQQVSEIHIVAVGNEVKELLWMLHKNVHNSIEIKTVNFHQNKKQVFHARWERDPEVEFTEPLQYLYEPNAAIMKSGLFGQLALEYGLKKLHPNSHLFSSCELKEFPGRRFEIVEKLPFQRKLLRKRFEKSKAHITTRNFPIPVDQLRRELKMADGGEQYLFFTTGKNQEKIVLQCRKIE